MEIKNGERHKITVCIYEFLGTAFLAYSVLMSYGNGLAVSLTVFAVIIVAGPVSGANINPAVSIGIFIQEKKFGQDIVLLLLMIVSQILGALFGILMTIGCLYNPNLNNSLVPTSKVPILAPIDESSLPVSSGYQLQTFLSQVILTFVFILLVLVLKGRNTNPAKSDVAGAFLVASVLLGCI